MSLITRTFTFTDGTTAYGSQVDSEIANIVNTINNLDTATAKWDQISVLNSSNVPLTVDNSSGTQDVADFKVNGVIKVSVTSTGVLQAANTLTITNTSNQIALGTTNVTTLSATAPASSVTVTIPDPGAAANVILSKGSPTMGTALAMGSNKITGLANGSAATDAAAYGQFSALLGYRRPNLQYSSGTVVNLETGLTGTSGQAAILFPDGSYRTDSTAGRINCNLAQNAVFNNATEGSNVSGLRTGSQTANTWYAFYAVKVTTFSTDFVVVADTVMPTQANFATLNTNFGTNGWVYLGVLANGDNSGATNVILKFVQTGHIILLYNVCTANSIAGRGIRYVTTAAGQTISWTYASGGTTGTQTPAQLIIGHWSCNGGTTAASSFIKNQAGTYFIGGQAGNTTSGVSFQVWVPLSEGILMTINTNNTEDINLAGYIDGVLGIGNPLL